jgi:hypothetical protein
MHDEALAALSVEFFFLCEKKVGLARKEKVYGVFSENYRVFCGEP